VLAGSLFILCLIGWRMSTRTTEWLPTLTLWGQPFTIGVGDGGVIVSNNDRFDLEQGVRLQRLMARLDGLHSTKEEFCSLTAFPATLILPLWIVVLFSAMLTAFVFWRGRGRPHNHCGKCGYNLTGNVSGICPESGTPCSKRPTQRQHPDATRRLVERFVLVARWGALVLLVALAIEHQAGPYNLSVEKFVAMPVLAGISLLLWLGPLRRWWKQRRRYPPGHCEQCGYNLTRIVSGICPECGRPTTADVSDSRADDQSHPRLMSDTR